MTHEDLVRIANEHYPDECVLQAYEKGDGDVGDTLAEFIVLELDGCEGDEPEEALEVAAERMMNAAAELQAVADGLDAARRQLRQPT